MIGIRSEKSMARQADVTILFPRAVLDCISFDYGSLKWFRSLIESRKFIKNILFSCFNTEFLFSVMHISFFGASSLNLVEFHDGRFH